MNTEYIQLIILLVLLFSTAFMYSSVGHGGASGYLAVTALLGFAPSSMKTSVLILNIIVSLISFYQFYRAGHFDWKLFLPFGITSIPMAFLGAKIPLSDLLYKKILGICLLLSIVRLVLMVGKEDKEKQPINTYIALIIGATIGLLSGMLGIGGGILLSPILLLLHWAKMKETAAVAALFIFVNSVAGLLGLPQGIHVDPQLFYFVAATATGGILGGWLGSKVFNTNLLKYLLAIVLCIASAKLLFT